MSTSTLPGVTTATTLGLLQRAARDRQRVWVSFVDGAGATAALVVQPLSVGGGFLRAVDDRTDTLHTFALHRIAAVAHVDDSGQPTPPAPDERR